MSAEHKCNKEAEIENIKTKVERIVKVLEGNGQKGLVEIVTILNSNLSNLNDNMKSINLTINDLLLYKSETEGFRKAKTVDKADKFWTYGIVVTLLGIIVTLVIVLIK